VAKITEKQKRFAQEYLVDLNATAAAIRAGYSPKTATEQGSRLLTNVKVQEEIQRRQVKLQNKLEITQERVIEELAAIAFANGTDFVTVTDTGLLDIKPTHKVPKEKLPAIAGLKYNQMGVEIKLHDKVRALELLGKHLGVFDSNNGGLAAEENNIFDVIDQSTKEELDTSEISEIEPPAKSGADLVE
jgi:phage terminase small subunit